MDTLDEARRRPYWEGAIASETARVIIAEVAGGLKGVISIAPSEHPAFGAMMEIKHLYVAQDAQGQGIGARLLQAAFDYCRPHAVALAVVRQNDSARRFYARMGGVETAGFVDPGPLWRSDNVVVVFDTLALDTRSLPH
ncbi:MAG: GNAT family N-acetyltransferase [Pseudomonadota bacterium]